MSSFCEIALKDCFVLMNIACFRLGSRATRDVIYPELLGVTVEVPSGRHGLATISASGQMSGFSTGISGTCRQWL